MNYGLLVGYSASVNPTSNTDSSTNDKNHTNGVSVVITTSNNLNIDFALKQEMRIGNHIWVDAGTPDGIYNGSDQPVSGVVVTATSSGGQNYTGVTDVNGLYTITVPANDTYTVNYGLPVGYSAGVNPTSNTDSITNDRNHDNGVSVVITTTSNANLDFALKQEVLLGNHIWVDAGTPDGIYNGSDQPVSGVVVTATSSGGQTYYTATTDATGLYTITVPANDTYSVSYGLPSGYFASVNPTSNTDSSTNDKNHTNGVSVVITTSNNLNIDFALKQEMLIGNRIWVDAGTPDGIYNSSDQPVSGVVVTATSSDGQTYTGVTDVNGLYTITVPANDTYTVNYGLPVGYSAGVNPTSNTDSSTNDKNHTNGVSVVITTSNNLNIDFALKQEVLLGNHIWVDAGTPDGIYNGSDQSVSGVVVTATSSGGQTYVATTDVTGLYTITVPANDTYTVNYGLPVGYSAGVNPTSNTDSSTNDKNHTNGVSVVITTSNNSNIDFALKQEVLIGNRVWIENDGDGLVSTGVITPVVGAVVTATSTGGVVYTATTDSGGYYSITVHANDAYVVSMAMPNTTIPSTIIANDGNNLANDNKNHKFSGTPATIGITNRLHSD